MKPLREECGIISTIEQMIVLSKAIWNVLERLVEKRKNITIDRERPKKIACQIEFMVKKLEIMGWNSDKWVNIN